MRPLCHPAAAALAAAAVVAASLADVASLVDRIHIHRIRIPAAADPPVGIDPE